MTIGVIATLASFAVAAVFARGRFMDLLARTEDVRLRAGQALELAGACAVVVLGVAMLGR